MILAKVELGQVRTRFGFEVDGIPGRRELVIFLFGSGADFLDTWQATQRKLNFDELDQLRDAAARGNDRGDLMCGRLLFDVVP